MVVANRSYLLTSNRKYTNHQGKREHGLSTDDDEKSDIFNKILMLLAFLIVCISISAQTPPPPNQGYGSTENEAPSVGEPIGNGTFILFVLAAVYAGRRVYRVNAAETQE